MNKAAIRITRLKPGMLSSYVKNSDERKPSSPRPDFRAAVEIGPLFTLIECFRERSDAYFMPDRETDARVSSVLIRELTPTRFGPPVPWQVAGGCIDFRFYRAEDGQLENFLDVYEHSAFPIQDRVLGKCCGFFSEPDQSSVIHFWWYENPSDRESRRADMLRLPEWHAYVKQGGPYLREMNNWLIYPLT